MLPNFNYVRVDEVKEAVKQLSAPGAVVHAGGTDLLGCLQDGIFQAGTLVSISRANSLKGIRQEAGGVRIGSITSLTEIARNPVIKERYQALADAASEVASPQLRNQGTIGGNICQKPRCWYYRRDFHCLRKGGEICYAVSGDNRFHCIFGGDPCYIVHPSDTAPALVALEGQVRMVGPTGMRTIPVEEFFVSPGKDATKETVLKPGEVVTDILLPGKSAGCRSFYRKIRARGAWDFALAGVAVAAQMEGGAVKACRIVLSGASPVPWRCFEAEKQVVGKQVNPSVVAAAAEAAVKNAQPMEHNAYKVQMFRGLLEQELSRLSAA